MPGGKRRRRDEEEAHAGAGGDEDGFEDDVVDDDDDDDDIVEDVEEVVGGDDDDDDEDIVGDEEGDDELDDSDVQEAGTLRKLVVKNLMCHKKLEINFNRNVNFIVGRNGAGKSAICAAVQLVFGASATETDRGDSLSKMVRNDCKDGTAVIELTLSNQDPPGQPGAHSFKRDEYGDEITVVRTLRRSGTNKKTASSTLETRTSTGQRHKSGKAAREEVAAIRDTFNIQATNPLVVITQETSKKFAVTDGSQKFKLLMKATQLQAAYDNIVQMTVDRQAAKDAYRGCQAKKKAADAELKAARHEFQRISQVKELAGRVRVADVQLSNAEAHAVLNRSETVAAALARAAAKTEAARKQLQQNAAERRQLDEEATQKLAALDKLVEEADRKRAAIQALHSQRSSAQTKFVKEQRRLQKLDKAVEQAQAQRAKAMESIDRKRAELEARSRDDPVARAQQLVVDADTQLREAKAKAEAEDRKLRQWEAEDENDLGALETQLEQHQEMQQDVRAQMRATESSLRAARADGDAFTRRLESLGDNAALLYRMVQSNLSKFSAPPFGPVAAFVEMREEHKQWATAVAASINKFARGWVVQNAKDMQLLRELARRAKVAQLNVDIFKVPRTRIEMPPPMVVEGELRGLDCIDTSDPTTYNVLVELTDLAQTVFASKEECQQRSQSGQRSLWPRRAVAMTSETGRTWKASRGATTIRSADVPGNYLSVLKGGSAAAQVGELEEQLEELKPRLEAAARTIEETSHRLAGLKRTARRLATAAKQASTAAEKLKLKAKKCRQAYERAQRESDNAQTVDISGEEAEIESAESDLRDLQQDRPEVLADVEAAKAEADRLEAEVNRLSGGTDESVIAERRSEVQQLAGMDTELSARAVAVQGRVDRYDAKQAALASQLEQYRQEYTAAQEEVQKQCAAIQAAHGDDALPGDPSTWDTSVENCKGAVLASRRALRAAQEAADVSDEQRDRIERRHTQAIMEADKSSKRCAQAKAMIKTLKHSTAARYGTWQEVNRRVQEQASQCFRQLMMRKGHIATMRVVTDTHEPDQGEVVLEVAADAAVREYGEEAYGTAAATQAADSFAVEHDDGDDEYDDGPAAGRATGKKRPRDTSRDVGGLSGGEKSFTSLCLLCAITKEVEVPFQVMDEFDVFMDEGTRLSAMEMLLGHAAETNRQFIFITPHDISSAVDSGSDKVSVWSLAPPVRD